MRGSRGVPGYALREINLQFFVLQQKKNILSIFPLRIKIYQITLYEQSDDGLRFYVIFWDTIYILQVNNFAKLC